MPMTFFFEPSHSDAYAKYRPKPPQELTNKILHYLQEKVEPPLSLVLDLGCGPGQSTLLWTPRFQRVLGVDVSENQIAEARKFAEGVANVTYSVSSADDLPVESGTVQLLTASQSFHWLDKEKVYQEAKRVLAPNGVLAIYKHWRPMIITDNEEQTRLANEHYREFFRVLNSLVDPRGDRITQLYENLGMPFQDTKSFSGIEASLTCTVADFEGFITSLSLYQKYGQVNGKEEAKQCLKDFSQRLLEILQSPKSAAETEIRLLREYRLYLGRQSQSTLEQETPF